MSDYQDRFDALMRRINDNHEAVLIELRSLRTSTEVDIRLLRSLMVTTQELVLRSPDLIVQALQVPLLDRLTAIEARMRKLED